MALLGNAIGYTNPNFVIMNIDTVHSPNGEDHGNITPQHLDALTDSTASITNRFADATAAIKGELEIVVQAINTWERMAPQLYQMRKRLQVAEELLSGKRKVESISALPAEGEKKEKKKRGPAKGTKTFVKKKSDILTDAVLEKIRDYIALDQEYHKSKDIYHYLLENNIIQPFGGPKPEHAFAIALARVDQNVIKYNDHYTIMAWGLPDFGTPEHLRRKALTGSARGEKGTRVTSYGREPVAVE